MYIIDIKYSSITTYKVPVFVNTHTDTSKCIEYR